MSSSVSNHKKAIIVVDVQPGFVKDNIAVVEKIVRYLTEHSYDACVEAIFHAPEDSLWKKQVDWTFPLEETHELLRPHLPSDRLLVTKTTKSVWKGDQDLLTYFRERNIEEIHIVGFDTNDCVFATAQESFDNGFFTYVIEECCGSSAGREHHEAALMILRELGMTNHSEK